MAKNAKVDVKTSFELGDHVRIERAAGPVGRITDL